MPVLNRKVVAALPGPAENRSEIIYWCSELAGFALRVSAAGARRWIVRYRIGRRQRVVTIGSVAELSPTAARERARAILAGAALGLDERAAIDARKAAASEQPEFTFKALADRYLERARKRLRPKSLVEVERTLLRYATPLHKLAVDGIKRRHIAEILCDVAERSGPIAANRARAHLSALFTWAMREGLVEQSPAVGTGRQPERSRERVLAPDELRAIWRAAEPGSDYGRIVRLLMLCGQRREEAGGLHWQELDLEAGLWHLPAERSKNRRAHVVPLSGPALELLAGLPRWAGRSTVFGLGPRKPGDPERGFTGWSAAKRRLDARIAAERGEALEHWTLHDLRRSTATNMAEIGVAPHVIEAVLNHVSGHKGGVAGVYNRANYAAETRRAVELWAAHLLEVVEGQPAQVVPMRAKV
jgi:integrase